MPLLSFSPRKTQRRGALLELFRENMGITPTVRHLSAITGHSNATKPPASRTATPIFSVRPYHDEDGSDCRSSDCRRSSNSSWVHGSILVISGRPHQISSPNRGRPESGIVLRRI